MKLSAYGAQMAQPSAIADLMQDLGEALNTNPEILFLGGGNPAVIPAVQAIFKRHLSAMLADKRTSEQWLGIYQSPQGNESLLESLTAYLQAMGFPITQKNLLVVNGGQTACYRIFNSFAGVCENGITKRVVLPLVPEYVGYRGLLLGGDAFQVSKPKLELLGEHRFAYQLDRCAFELPESAGIVALSRPTNPSARVLPKADLHWLLEQCAEANVPFMLDSAYGQPFPGIMPKAEAVSWQPGMINIISASKLGLPGLRTAVIVADEAVIELLTRASAIEGLAAGNTGPMLLDRLLRAGDMPVLLEHVQSFYRAKRQTAVRIVDEKLAEFDYYLHEPEGAFFLWLWLPGLSISSVELYEKLKEQGVLVMAGEAFFFGEDKRFDENKSYDVDAKNKFVGDNPEWPHAKECLRLNICQEESVFSRALDIIRQTLKSL